MTPGAHLACLVHALDKVILKKKVVRGQGAKPLYLTIPSRLSIYKLQYSHVSLL